MRDVKQNDRGPIDQSWDGEWDDLEAPRRRETYRFPLSITEELHNAAFFLQHMDPDVTATAILITAVRDQLQRLAKRYSKQLATEKIESGKLFPRRRVRTLRVGGNRGISHAVR